MNEINRQAYLSAFGIENYMPRWRLPMAPEPVACVLPVTLSAQPAIHSAPPAIHAEALVPRMQVPSTTTLTEKIGMATDVLASIVEPKRNTAANATPINAATILQQLGAAKTAAVVQPFTLSVWRPASGFLIIDSRNTKLALPTELLLNHVMRAVLGVEKIALDEDVLRWPMIENSFVSRTEDDARNELQTWLAVENELRPIKALWLLGDKAARYLLPPSAGYAEILWQLVPLANKEIHALILPSLNELLQQPTLKAKLWQCLV